MADDISFLSNTTFHSDKTDLNPVPLDAYGVTGNGVYNRIEKYTDVLGIDTSGLMRGYKWVKENLPIMRSIYRNGKAVVDGGNWATRMAAASSLFKDGFPYISADMPADVANTIAEKFNENQGLFVKIGSSVDMVNSTNFNDVSQIGNLIGNLTGSQGLFEIEDRASITAVMTGLAIEGCRAGFPGVVNSIIRSTDNREILQQFLCESFPDLIKLGDVEVIRDLKAICEDQGFTIERLGSVESILANVDLIKEHPEQALALFKGGHDVLDTFNYGRDTYMEIAGDRSTPVIWSPSYLSTDMIDTLSLGVIQGKVDPIMLGSTVNVTGQINKLLYPPESAYNKITFNDTSTTELKANVRVNDTEPTDSATSVLNSGILFGIEKLKYGNLGNFDPLTNGTSTKVSR